jgi:2-polyprenyl-6-methoxyphenol hydroxylase-like FAD-dependent oxidoreductase
MAGLLFARAGCRTLVLEKHADFLRDFRGDTVHPSTLENMKELGLLEDFLSRPHQRLEKLSGVFGEEKLTVGEFSRLDASCKFIVFMPQWHFLDFLSSSAKAIPPFSIEMEAEVRDLIFDGGRVAGVRAETKEGPLEVRAALTIGADGRGSIVREKAGLNVLDIGAPIDVLWFSIPCDPGKRDEPLLNTGPGHIVITIDRGDYYQCALVIPKGEAKKVVSGSLPAFRDAVARTAPQLVDYIGALASFDDVRLLTVKIDRLESWSRPGLLMIGDAAHAMSPLGGVGINLAIQDAVAAANILAEPLANGSLDDDRLDDVRQRRLWPVRATQFVQVQMQNRVISPILAEKSRTLRAPLAMRIISRAPMLRRLVASVIGMGFRPEHIRSPEVFKPGV